MSSVVVYACNGCGKPVDAATAAEFAGIWQGQASVAAGNVHDWHTCSPECAGKYLRAVADAAEARGKALRAAREEHAAHAAAVAEHQAKLAAERAPGPAPGK